MPAIPCMEKSLGPNPFLPFGKTPLAKIFFGKKCDHKDIENSNSEHSNKVRKESNC